MGGLQPLGLTFVFTILTILLQINEVTSTSNDNFATDGEEFYSYFISEAPLHSGDYQSGVTMKDIPWVDMNLLHRASHYYKSHFPGISVSHFYALIEVMGLKSATSVLLPTGNFGNRTIAGSRLVRTVFHIREWCNSGPQIFNPESKIFKSLQIVRNRHKSAAYVYKQSTIANHLHTYENIGAHKALVSAIRADLSHVDTRDAPMHLLRWNSTTPVSQFDLAVVQFLFYCHSTMNPTAFGVLYAASSEDRKAFVHLWAVLGRLLGIQDRFNVALNLPYERNRHFYINIIVANLKNVDETVVSLMSNTINGWYDTFLVPSVFKLKCWLFYSLSNAVPGFTGQNIKRLMDLEDKVCLVYLSQMVSGLNLSKSFNSLGILTFNNWFDKEVERLRITS